MKLHEYQSKRIFARYGIPVPKGEAAATPEAARQIAEQLTGQVVVKSQALVSGRGQADGIQAACSPQEAEVAAQRMLGMTINGLIVQQVLVEALVGETEAEIYLAITIDRSLGKSILIASTEGGVEIEAVAKARPEMIARIPIDPLLGLLDFQARDLAFDLGFRRSSINSFVQIAKNLYRVFVEMDASLAEINPLIVTAEGELIAADAKIELDDNALFRHQDLVDQRNLQEENEIEYQARLAGLSYVKLDGDIGCIVNGAGLAMATLDVVKHYGGEPANFLDIGGQASAEKVALALRLILTDPKVKTILLNIFGGITRCDEVACGILAALDEVKPKVPLVVRLAGTNEAEGRAILAKANLARASSFGEAARKAVALVKGAAVV